MKNIVTLGIILLGIAICAIMTDAKKESVCEISFYYGDVGLRSKGEDKWEDVDLDQPVYEGDAVKTMEDSRAELTLIEGSAIRIDENSTFNITTLASEEEKIETKTELVMGRIWSNVKKLATGSKLEMGSPVAVAAVRGTVYRMDVAQDKSTNLKVYVGEVAVSNVPIEKGEIKKPGVERPTEVAGPREVEGPKEVSMEEWIVIVRAQMEIHIAPDGKYRMRKFDLVEDAKDEWVAWNKERDKK